LGVGPGFEVIVYVWVEVSITVSVIGTKCGIGAS
jgi:hypothetical protein